MNAYKQSPNHQKLATAIKRELGTGRTVRFFRAMPAFKLATDVPEHLRQLLDRLEEREIPAPDKRRL